MTLLIKPLHPDFTTPRYETTNAAGFDLHAMDGVIVAVDHARFDLVDELPGTERGTGGFGSTGA